ncbi:MAG: FAD-binding oxidoreductase [Candidatus Aminicenantaceae bacterium]
MYAPIDSEIIDALIAILGERGVVTDPDAMQPYSHDEFALSEIAHMPEVVVKPETVEQVAGIMQLASEKRIPVTPRGGATGLAGGCVPSQGGLSLSLERMNRILEIDTANQMAVVEAGVTLSEFFERVEDAGLFFPPHPGDEGAMIGGLIATNAGGARAVKYGVIRNYIRGLEVVLPTGEIIHPGGKVMKSSTGYNLVNLFIGSEGTLGVVTQAVIQLMPKPAVTRSLIIPYDDLQSAIDTVPDIIQAKIQPMAVEFLTREVVTITEKMLNQSWPCSQGTTYLLIILDAASEAEMDTLSEAVAQVCLDHEALDVFVADSPQKQEQVLGIRSKIYEAIKDRNIETLDIVVPRAEIARHVARIQEVQDKYGLWLPTYGHAADGNVHTHIMCARLEEGEIVPLSDDEWKPLLEKVRADLYQDCRERDGMISGEHGIGLVKKAYLSYVLDAEEIALMKRIKQAFDPQHIMNPDKIL